MVRDRLRPASTFSIDAKTRLRAWLENEDSVVEIFGNDLSSKSHASEWGRPPDLRIKQSFSVGALAVIKETLTTPRRPDGPVELEPWVLTAGNENHVTLSNGRSSKLNYLLLAPSLLSDRMYGGHSAVAGVDLETSRKSDPVFEGLQKAYGSIALFPPGAQEPNVLVTMPGELSPEYLEVIVDHNPPLSY